MAIINRAAVQSVAMLDDFPLSVRRINFSDDLAERPQLATRVAMLALYMSDDEAATILTLAEEPDLLLEPDEPAPYLDPDLVAAARIVSDWIQQDTPDPIFH